MAAKNPVRAAASPKITALRARADAKAVKHLPIALPLSDHARRKRRRALENGAQPERRNVLQDYRQQIIAVEARGETQPPARVIQGLCRLRIHAAFGDCRQFGIGSLFLLKILFQHAGAVRTAKLFCPSY